MSDEATPREIALRLLAAWSAGPETYRAFIAEERLALPRGKASDVIHELVQLAGGTIAMVSEQNGVAFEDALVEIERGLDNVERRYLEGEDA